MAKPKSFDISIEEHGSIFLLRPLNEQASDWLHEHVAEDAQWLRGALVVEHRYIMGIVRGAKGDGLRVRRDFSAHRGVTPLSTVPRSDIAGADDALVPREIESGDPARWAEYNRKFNEIFTRSA